MEQESQKFNCTYFKCKSLANLSVRNSSLYFLWMNCICISLPVILTVLLSFVIFCSWFTKPPVLYAMPFFFQLTYLLPSCFSIFFKNQPPPYECIFPFDKRNLTIRFSLVTPLMLTICYNLVTTVSLFFQIFPLSQKRCPCHLFILFLLFFLFSNILIIN